ncbi:MAG: TIGR01777 family oxidoreductase [Desulfobacterota bacterium]|nr:TIGR01777 family oxidoreductase [Thermodesulfobacteriota bacterium]
MQVAISGATGFIGTYLGKVFGAQGHKIVPLTRGDFSTNAAALAGKLKGCDAVINLAGAPIAARWTAAYKKVLIESRIGTTRMIVDTVTHLSPAPRVLISASGTGIYRSHGIHTEDDTDYADDFLGRLAQDWEREALKAESVGMRTVVFRFGVVLGKNGGALQRMLPLFRLGLGGRIGSGRQAFSWVHIADLARAIITAVNNPALRGIYNLTAPYPITNAELTRTLASLLHRPAWLPVPGVALKLLFGEAAAVLLEGQQVLPKRLRDAGFTFLFPTICEALVDILSRDEH